ncbi:MAG: helix-turn-helix transcriptional regulator [Clostridia bacterium]|nr:helix-turn-helix transcriptional regulator [Clostridia bacterium]
MDNKNIFASNLKRYMALQGKSRRDVCEALGFSYYTFSDWVNGKKYPRMDKVEMLANYFGVLKSDLIEDNAPEIKKNNDAISDIVKRLRTDDEFLAVAEILYGLNSDKIKGIKEMLKAFA